MIKKMFIIIFVVILDLFSMSFYLDKDEDFFPSLDYENLSYKKVLLDNDDFFYISDDFLPNSFYNVLIDRNDYYGKTTSNFYLHIDYNNSRYTKEINLESIDLSYSCISYESFLCNNELLWRFNHINFINTNKRVKEFKESRTNFLNTNTDTDVLIDFYEVPYYSTTENEKKINDPIIDIVPEEYFYSEGEKIFIGKEYGYYIRTTSPENKKVGQVFSSIVAIYDIEVEPAIFVGGASKPEGAKYNSFNSVYSLFSFNQKFCCYYETYERYTLSYEIWVNNYGFSDNLNKIVINSSNKFFNSAELMPYNFDYVIFGKDETGKIINDIDLFQPNVLYATTFIQKPIDVQISISDVYKVLQVLSLSNATFKAIVDSLEPTINAIDKIIDYYEEQFELEKQENIVDSIIPNSGSYVRLEEVISNYYLENYSFLPRILEFYPLILRAANSPITEERSSIVGTSNHVDIYDFYKKYGVVETYNSLEIEFNSLSKDIGNFTQVISYNFEMKVLGENKKFEYKYEYIPTSYISKGNCGYDNINNNTVSLEQNERIKVYELKFLSDDTIYFEPNVNDSLDYKIEIYIYDQIGNQVNFRVSNFIDSTSFLKGKTNEKYYVFIVNNSNLTCNITLRHVETLYSTTNHYITQKNITPVVNRNMLLIYEISTNYSKFMINTTGYYDTYIYLFRDSGQLVSFNDDAFYNPDDDPSDYNAEIVYENEINFYKGTHLVMIAINAYGNTMGSLTINFDLSA